MSENSLGQDRMLALKEFAVSLANTIESRYLEAVFSGETSRVPRDWAYEFLSAGLLEGISYEAFVEFSESNKENIIGLLEKSRRRLPVTRSDVEFLHSFKKSVNNLGPD